MSVVEDNRGTPRTARLLRAATAQGLVRFDAAGGVEPGLAERWIVIDDGRSIIFRLREAEWANGRPVVADDVVRSLRRALTPRNPLAPFLTAIDEIVAMTPQVIEVRLRRPRPDLLKLFAQPELAIPAPGLAEGSGPLRRRREGAGVLLEPAFDPLRAGDEGVSEPAPEELVRLRGERGAAAIARFAAKRSDLVDGGRLDQWPLLESAGVAPVNIRIDPAAGLFGLAVTSRAGLLSTPAGRGAVAMAIDRPRLTALFRSGWAPVEPVLPDRFESARAPAAAAWESVPAGDRIATAQATVSRWAAANGGAPWLRVALPNGPGGRLLFSRIAADLRAVGITADRLGPDAAADLRLVDAVAPYDSARWYLGTACQPCATDAATLIEAARDAPTLEARAQRLAEADAALAADIAFIPIASPLRWSLVAARLSSWTPNARAFHPLNHLRARPN